MALKKKQKASTSTNSQPPSTSTSYQSPVSTYTSQEQKTQSKQQLDRKSFCGTKRQHVASSSSSKRRKINTRQIEVFEPVFFIQIL